MAGFLYFRADDSRPINVDGIRKLRLDYVLDEGSKISSRAVNHNSMTGKAGLVFADQKRHGERSIGFYPDDQTWREMPEIDDRPSLWLGYWNDSKPTPEDLKRVDMLRGAGVKLADGQSWQVPIVRSPSDNGKKWKSELPAKLDYDKKGNIIRGEPLEQYQELWEITAPLAGQQMQKDLGEPVEMDEQQLYRGVFGLLRANYVVDMPELVMLGALADDISLSLIALVSCRYEEFMLWVEASKKKEKLTLHPNGFNTKDGVTV